MIITGALSGSWWAGDLNDQGVPRATQSLGAPRGYYVLDFDGTDYVDTYRTFGRDEAQQMHVSFNTPRFRKWAKRLYAFADAYRLPGSAVPPVTRNDLGDPKLLTVKDLAEGSWIAVNVWNGSKDSTVTVSIDGGDPMTARRTQDGNGEAPHMGPDFADPLALATQSTNGRMAFRSVLGGEATEGFQTWRGVEWKGTPGPFPASMLVRKSNHLWRADLPKDLAVGPHRLEVLTTDRHGRTFREIVSFEVVEELPPLNWRFGKDFD